MKKLVCSKCGSSKITSTKKMQRIKKPKNARPTKALVSYGRVYYEHICDCGNTWEEETHL